MITPLKFFFFFSLLVLDSRWAIIQRNRKCLKSFLSTRFYFILFCLLGPKGPSTERVEFLYISPTVQPKKTFRFSNSLSRVALFGLLIKQFFTSSRLPISAGEKIHWEKNRFTGTVFLLRPVPFLYFRPGEERNFRSISRKWFRNQKGKKGNWKFELEILDSWRADAREWLIGWNRCIAD